MLIIGLTGSIATGKSTVSDILRSPPYSLPIIDADKLAREVVEPGTAGYQKIVDYFGPSTPDLLEPAEDGKPNGANGKGRRLNRPALGRRVFGSDNEKDRKVLNGIVHPAVRSAMYMQMFKAYISGSWAVVMDIPLLFESGWEPLCGTIIVVGVTDKEEQIRRLRARDPHLSEEEAKNRVISQWDVRDKAARAEARGNARGVVVWNDKDKAHLRKEVDQVMTQIKSASPQWWALALLINPALMGAFAAWNYVLGLWYKRQWNQMKSHEKAKL